MPRTFRLQTLKKTASFESNVQCFIPVNIVSSESHHAESPFRLRQLIETPGFRSHLRHRHDFYVIVLQSRQQDMAPLGADAQ